MKNRVKRIAVFILTATIIVSCGNRVKPTAKDVLKGLQYKFNSHKSISYHVILNVKPIGHPEGYEYSVNCKLVKNLKDTLFNAYTWVSVDKGHYQYIRYYNLDKIYTVDDSLKTITTYNEPSTQYWAITGNSASGKGINIFFADSTDLIAGIKDTTTKLADDKINGEDCYKVTINSKDQDQLSQIYKNVWIRVKDTTLVQIKSHVNMQGKEGGTEWKINSIQYDNVTPESLQAWLDNKLHTYKVENYVPHEQKLLANGTAAPVFEGDNYNTGKHVSLADYKGKLVLLDFFYQDCIWCVRGMPLVEKVQDAFKDKGLVVLGINSIDNSDAGKKRFPDFIKTNKMNYDIVLTKHSTDSIYSVPGYPTFYLLDKKGNIVYSVAGYDPKEDSIMTVEVNKALKK
jgi:peroxiredoxin